MYRVIHSCSEFPAHCGVLSGIPGFFPLDASYMPFSSGIDQNCFRPCQIFPGRWNCPESRTPILHSYRREIPSSVGEWVGESLPKLINVSICVFRVSFKHPLCTESPHIQSPAMVLKIFIPGPTWEILVYLVWRKAWTAWFFFFLNASSDSVFRFTLWSSGPQTFVNIRITGKPVNTDC